MTLDPIDEVELDWETIPNGIAENLKKLERQDWYWNFDKRTGECIATGRNVMFHPQYAFGTAAVRGMKELTCRTVAYWEMRTLSKIFGTSVMFGVGTDKTPLRLSTTFKDLIGDDQESYGINHYGKAIHAGISIDFCKPLNMVAGDVISILFDGPNRTMSYFLNGKYLGTPFTEIDVSQTLYPIVSSTLQQSEFFLEKQSSIVNPCSLEDYAMNKVFSTYRHQLSSICVPPSLKARLMTLDRLRRSRMNLRRRPSPPKQRLSFDPFFMAHNFHFIRCGMGIEQE